MGDKANPYLEMDLLRLSTAGSVDDGKSTLIGRLLYDTKSILVDQLEDVQRTSRQRGEGDLNLALLTDGLRAEREQNITIDVAYRYFATPRRKFIMADTPGHVQYTRNMITGASTAELAIVLVDARKGVLTQSRRHGFIASLLRIPHVVVAINKMDLVGYAEEVYDDIVGQYSDFAERLQITDLTYIPISALHGDNVVEKSSRMEWYDGSTLLHHLESVNVGAARNVVDFRFPVQHVIRPHQDYRGFAGRIASGSVKVGEEVAVLPGGQQTTITRVDSFDGSLDSAAEGESVVLTIADEIDISRGDMIVRTRNLPEVGTRFDAMLCWMDAKPLDPSLSYRLMHTSREVQAVVKEIVYRIDVDTMHRAEAATLLLNDIGRVQMLTSRPVFFDAYDKNHTTGSFILVDPHTNATVGAGMIRGSVAELPDSEAVRKVSEGVVWQPLNVPREEREAAQGHGAAVVWLTGLSGSGKSSISREVERRLFDRGVKTMLLDGDQLRHGLNGDLGFSQSDRRENIRRVSEVARLFFEQGSLVLCAFVSPYAEDRARARGLLPKGRFVEVFVDCSVEAARERDPKGLYAKADRGEIAQFTGVSAPYEAPESPELSLNTEALSADQAADRVIDYLESEGLITGQ